MDGQPVEGAMVQFVTEDGNQSFAGMTDAGGNFSLEGGAKPGALPGTYKVIVVKYPKVQGADAMTPGGADYLKQMEKEGKDIPKGGGPTAMPVAGPGGKMMMPKPGGKSASAGQKSELPQAYAVTTSTPFTIKVPPDQQPVKLELKSKP